MRISLRRSLTLSTLFVSLLAAPHNAPQAQGPEKSFSYDLLTAGDCVLERGELTFSASGQGSWRATIHTNHTTNRDIWHVSFNVLDAQGRQVMPVFLGDSPNMYGSPSPRIPWAVNFNFNPGQFAAINRVTVRTSC